MIQDKPRRVQGGWNLEGNRVQAVATQDEFIGIEPPTARAWVRRHRLLLVALALSVLVHGLLLFIRRHELPVTASLPQEQAGDLPLAITLAPPVSRAGPPTSPRPDAAPPARRPPPARTPPPVIATPRPAPQAAPVPPAVPAEPAPPLPAPSDAPSPPAAPPMDMMAQINAARQRRREAASPTPSEAPPTEDQRALGNAMRNLRSLTPGQDEGTNGVFQITRIGYGSAEFSFRGWNTNFRRNWAETVRVERGNNPDIELAVVRKMIEIIRRYEARDFVWESRRLGRNVTLSARTEDSAGLEDFLLKEFFPEYRVQ